MNILSKLRTGNRFHQAGRLVEAEAMYKQVLQYFPNHPDALHLSGLLAYQKGDHDVSIQLIERAVQANPSNEGYLKNLCTVLSATGQIDKAIGYMEKALGLSPDSGDLWFQLANCLQKREKFRKAICAYRKLLEIKPAHFQGYHNLATALHAMGEYDEAIACYQKVLELNPQFPQAWYHMGNSWMTMGVMKKAISAMQKALFIKPDYSDALFNLAKMYKDTGQIEASISTYTALLKINPTLAEGYNNLGNLFFEIGQQSHACELYRQALKINKDYPEALFNMSISLQDMGDLQEAMAYCRQALDIEPDYADAMSSLVHQKRQACDWKNLNHLDAQLDVFTENALTKGLRPAEGPFLNLCRHADPALNLALAKSWSMELVRRMQSVLKVSDDRDRSFEFIPAKHIGQKITIGYLSNNFRNHPTAQLMCGLFELQDRSRFSVHCYSYGEDDNSVYRKQIKRKADKFVELGHLNDQDAAAVIYQNKVDILIDLTGYMKGHRMGISGLRPAAVQARYLGQAGTSGADFFDYLIADAIVVPESDQMYYTEKLVYLPHSYQINNHRQATSEISYTREYFGLPPKSIVFCAFSSHYKLDPKMFASWMRILTAVDESVLWLIPGSQIAEQNLKKQAASHGVDSQRILFATRLPKDQHLARLKLADIALDTRIVGGAATTSDALWADVPVITLQGRHFASRMSASLLNAVGLPELICDSLAAYESLAIDLARNPTKGKALRQKLSENKITEPLFNTPQTVRNLESAYQRMWQYYLSGQGPQPFAVPECPDQQSMIQVERKAR